MPFQGIQSLPVRFDPEKDWTSVRQFLMSLQTNMNSVLGELTAPRAPVQFTVTAVAFANIIRFAKTNGDRYDVMWGPTANFKDAYPVDIGDTGYYVDYIGKDAVTRYYWVRAVNSIGVHSALYSNVVGPVAGTTLTVAGAVAPPAAPFVGDRPVTDLRTGFLIQDPDRSS